MPLIESTSYSPSFLLKNGHLSTIYTALYRRAPELSYRRITIPTGDGDFLDLDLSFPGTEVVSTPERSTGVSRVVVLLHGLEGSAEAHYIRGMAASIHARLLCPTVSVNFRGCSGRPNLTERSYHSGATEDLQEVIRWVEGYFPGAGIALVGFSLGGNVTLKYLGEGIRRSSVAGGVAVSVPCDLTGSARVLSRAINQIYMRRFMKDLVWKLELKNRTLGTRFDIAAFRRMKTFAEFDGAYTAPIHGYISAEDYWQRCSSRQFMHGIDVPTLLINARNDPFLSESCLPREIAAQSEAFFLEIPEFGGHVGFLNSLTSRNHCWQESRTVEFLDTQVFGI